MIRLLSIEDQPDIQTILKLTLEASGRFEVDAADNGADGIAAALESQPDAILLDFSLPDMNGLEVLDLLKNEARTTHIPVILLTAMTQSAEVETCRARGAIDALIKPFNPRTLAQQVETLLQAHRSNS